MLSRILLRDAAKSKLRAPQPQLLSRAELASMRERNKTYGQVDDGTEDGEGHGLGGAKKRSVCC